MNKILLLSMVAVSFTFASSYTNSEKILKYTFKTKFKCTPVIGCVGKNIILEDIKIGKMRIELTDDFKLNYSKKSIFKKVITVCGKDKKCISKIATNELSGKVKNIFSQSKKVELESISIYNKKDKNKLTIKEVIINNNSTLHRIDMENLSINDLLINLKISLKEIHSTKPQNIVSSLKMILPKSKKVQYDKINNKLVEVNNPLINTINNKFILMYSQLFNNKNLSTISEIDLSINSEENNNNLLTTVNININDSISGESNFEIDFKIRDTIKKINAMSTMSELELLVSALSNVIIDRVYFKKNQEKLVSKHKELLLIDKEYKNNYRELITLIRKTEDSLSLYNRFGYKLLSLSYINSSILIKNKNEMKIIQFMKMISTIENKDFFEVVESYK